MRVSMSAVGSLIVMFFSVAASAYLSNVPLGLTHTRPRFAGLGLPLLTSSI
jgi:hypothetical protein